jgi:hypothetical protein
MFLVGWLKTGGGAVPNVTVMKIEAIAPPFTVHATVHATPVES